MMQSESGSLKQKVQHWIFCENVVFFSVWTLSTYDPTITDSLRMSISDVPFHGLHYSSVTCGALHPAECSGHSGQHPLPLSPEPTSEHSQNTHTAVWPSPCPQQALSHGTEEMSSPHSVSEYKVLLRVWIEHRKLLPLLYTSPLRPQEVLLVTGYHTDSIHNLLKINLNL